MAGNKPEPSRVPAYVDNTDYLAAAGCTSSGIGQT